LLQKRAFIFLNGDFIPEDLSGLDKPHACWIAVDGGVRHFDHLARLPEVLIGDLDSVSKEDLAKCLAAGVKIMEFPPIKDETDFELALSYAARQVSGPIYILGALGGRIDHALANISLLLGKQCKDRDIQIISAGTALFFIHQHSVIAGKPGETISLIPWGAICEGVSTRGLRFPLDDETLFPEKSRGISNVMLNHEAEVFCRKGSLLCVHHFGKA